MSGAVIPNVLQLVMTRVYSTRLCAGHRSNIRLLDLPLHGYYIQPAMHTTFCQSVLPDVEDNTSVDIVMTGYVIMILIKQSKNYSRQNVG